MEELQFAEYLRHTGLKLTRARRVILQEAFRTHGHFDAEALYSRLKKRRAGVSRATVYRTLPLLVNSNLVRKLDLGEGRSTFEHTLGHPHHDHLVCIDCGSVFEFHNPKIETLQQGICKEFDFEMLSHSQQIYGRCKDCRRK
ncbi:MAG: Fur family transcriptional regulator [bacterium]|nr:Fur family transcriptional regulator [bacterium]